LQFHAVLQLTPTGKCKIFVKTSDDVVARLETKGHVAQGMQIFTHCYRFQSHE